MRKTTMILLLLACCNVPVKQKVHRVNASTKGQTFTGVYYTLPRNVIIIEVPITRTETKPGLFAKQLDRAYPDWRSAVGKYEGKPEALEHDIAKKNKTDDEKKAVRLVTFLEQLQAVGIPVHKNAEATLRFKTSTPKVSIEAEADPNHVFLVEIKGGAYESRSLEMELTARGFMTTASASAQDRSTELAVEIIKTAASVVGTAVFGGVDAKASPSPLDAVLQTAQAVITEIGRVRAARRALLSPDGYGDLSKETLERMLTELNKAEQAFVRYFRTEAKSKWTARFEIRPPARGAGPLSGVEIQLFSLYSNSGVVSAVDGGLRVPKTFSAGETGDPKKLTKFSAVLHAAGLENEGGGLTEETLAEGDSDDSPSKPEPVRDDDAFADVIAKNGPAEQGVRGFYYRVPLPVAVTVMTDKQDLLTEEVMIAQLGVVRSLPSETGSTNVTYSVTLDPLTGGLSKVSVVSQALDPALVTQVGESVTGLVTAAKDADKNRLQRKKDELQLELDIRNLEEQLEGDDDDGNGG